MRVIGTAGHVDHGKSTLVAALTGTHPDRLKEEKEREMTIELGFAWMSLPGGEEVGIVDVPGHRDFIENMLAGIGGIDAALLVIAADEGVMPQTQEHLAILDLLQIKSGIVVMTKIDLVDDPAWLDLVETEIRNLLKGTFLQDAPILRVSSRTRQGLPALIQTLEQTLEYLPPRHDLGRPRLPVDRVFTMPGFGTIVTGTLMDGSLVVGDEVEILPSGLRGRIRGLQTHKKKETRSIPGSRTAINISGLDVEQLQRGEVVTSPGQYHATQRIDLSFHLLPNATSPLRHHTQVKFFSGTSETIGEVRLLGTETLDPGGNGWLQLDLHAPIVVVRGDRYILRRPSPSETLGGGTVVDPAPKSRHKRFDAGVIKSLETMAQGSPAEILFQAFLALGISTVNDGITRSRLADPDQEGALVELLNGNQLIQLDQAPSSMDSIVVSAPHWSDLKDNIISTLSSYHEKYPLRRGMPREELKSRLKLAPRIFNLVVTKLSVGNILTEGAKWVALPGHIVRFSPFQQVKVDKLMEEFTSTPNTPPTVKECLAEVGEDIFSALIESGLLVSVSSEIVFRKIEYEGMVERIRQTLQKNGRITLGDARDLLQTSRKYAQAFLEHLDAIGMTKREEDFRRLIS